jgi:hypothetical protein
MNCNHDPNRLGEYATVIAVQDKAIWTCLRCSAIVRIFPL